jgi:tetratricopeptide (TPR) repeat protein
MQTSTESKRVRNSGLLSRNAAREANYLNGIYQQLGASARAVATADEALALSQAQPVRSYAAEAQIRHNLVDVFLELGDLDAATEAVQPVLRLSPDRRLHTLTRRVERLGRRLAATQFVGNDAAQPLQQQIAAFVGTPASAVI